MKLSRGFTLIELMITVVIIGILSSIVYPSYRTRVMKSKRAAAKTFMMTLSGREEQIMLDRRAYVTYSTTNNSLPALPPDVSPYYTIAITVPAPAPTPAPSFSIVATPIAGSMMASDPALTLISDGTKSPDNLWN